MYINSSGVVREEDVRYRFDMLYRQVYAGMFRALITPVNGQYKFRPYL